MRYFIPILLISAVCSAVFAENEGGLVFMGVGAPQVDEATGAVIQKRYWRSTSSTNWIGAYESCRQQGGSLVQPSNPLFDDDLRNHLFIDNFGASIWIGAKQTGTAWNWVGLNIPVGYTNWRTGFNCGASSGYCAYATGAAGSAYSWCSTNCGGSFHYVCEV